MKMLTLRMMAAITLSVAMSTIYADDNTKYPDTNEVQPAQPSTHASARKTMKAADRKLSRDVRKAIAKGGEVDVSRLGVVAHTGKVTLVGSVPQSDQIDLATQRAQSVTGVTNVASRLTIDVPGGR